MKRFFKIFGITLGSLIGLVLVVVGLALYVVLTPKRLTAVVHRVADSFITCPYEIGKVDLTIVKTFPYVGLEVQGLYVINPIEGAPSDTVLAVPKLVVGVDIMKALDGDIYIKTCTLEDMEANIYIDSLGNNNFTVWADMTTEDTELEEDTTDSAWRLRSIGLEDAIRFSARKLSLVDKKDSLVAGLTDCSIQLSATEADSLCHAKLDLDANHVSFQMKEEQLADNLHLRLTLPALFRSSEHITIDGTQIAIEEYTINVDGYVGSPCFDSGVYNMDVTIKTNEWKISNIWHLVPPSYQSLWPKEVDADGHLQLLAHAIGTYDSVSMPLIDAQVLLTGAQGRYTPLPYYFDEMQADLTAHVDLNKKANMTATLNNLFVQTGTNTVRLSGSANHIFKNKDGFVIDNPAADIKAEINVDLAEANRYLNSDSTPMHVSGRAKGALTAAGRLDDITNSHWSKLKAQAQLNLTKVDFLSDSLQAAITSGQVNARLDMPKDETSAIPTIALRFDLDDVQASMDTLFAHVVHPIGSATIKATRRDPSAQRVNVAFSAEAMQANMGELTDIKTGNVSIEAKSRYNKEGENIFFKWNPRLKFDLQNATAHTPTIPVEIAVPQIRFSYSNRDFAIDTSRIVLGKSDFNLSGDIRNFGKWTQHKDTLVGVLNFTSSNTDVDELLSLLPQSQEDTLVANEQTESDRQAEPDSSQAKPFIVPKTVNLTLNTRIANAHALDQDLKNLGGSLVMRNGEVYLDQMGFVCEAAKLQLSAIYKTPRTDHIYVGLDYHMVDVDIQQLISMIPQIDTLVPMLNSFRGKAQFHLAAETYVNERYQLKPSTIRGACSIEGKDLVLLDNETFSKIAKVLMFSKKTENKIDSLSAQITLYKDEITVYPFCVSMDNYLVALGGNHYLDMNFNYHADLLKPLYIGVDVKGNLDDLKIAPATCIYAQDFRPIIHKDTETKSQEIRRIISDNLKKNVKIK